MASHEHYDFLVRWLITALYIHLKVNGNTLITKEIFDRVYVNARVVYNFATYIGVATHGFADFYSDA